jgi:hypothetical protein
MMMIYSVSLHLFVYLLIWQYPARVAKLVDALDLGSSVFDVGVQVPPRAPHCF